MPFPTPRESSQPRDGTVVSCMGRWILYHHHNHLGSLGEALKSVSLLSCVWLFVTPWTVASQAPLSMEFFRQEYWCGLPCPSPEDLPNSEIEYGSSALQADTIWATKEACSRLPLKGTRDESFLTSSELLILLGAVLGISWVIGASFPSLRPPSYHPLPPVCKNQVRHYIQK